MRSNRTNGEGVFAPCNFTDQTKSSDIQFVSAANAANIEETGGLGPVDTTKSKTPPTIPVHKKISAGKFSKRTGLFILAGIAFLSLSSALIIKKNHKDPVEQNVVQATSASPINNDIKPIEEKTISVEDKEKLVRKNWREYIHVNNSNYAYGVIGGINNLSVLFYNKSDYRLEQIVAKITYIKANGKPWKSKLVSVYNVAPHSERKESLPKVSRGKSVEVSVEKVVSKEMHFNYETGKKSANADDPYLSK